MQKRIKTKRFVLGTIFVLLLIAHKDYFLDFISPYSFYDDLISFNTTYNFSTVLDVRNACSNELFAIFLITSRPSKLSLRKTIRETWGSNLSSYNSKLLFIVGTVNDVDVQAQIEQEYSNYFDLVQMDFVDSYFNLSIKSVMLLKWAVSTCSNKAKYVIKVDDDTYINMELFMEMLKENQNPRMLLGSIHRNSKPIRNKFSKWYCPNQLYGLGTFPPYITGFCYAMSMQTAQLLYETSRKLPFIHFEDVLITGLAAKKANINLTNNENFFHDPLPYKKLIKKRFIAAHYVKENTMKLIHHTI